MKKIFIFCLPLFLQIVSFAAIDEQKSDVYFANGILTEREDAKNNAFEILKPAIIDDIYHGLNNYNRHVGKVDFAYNETHKKTKDLLESILQKFGWTALNNLLNPSHSTDLEKQVKAYKESINIGHKVLVVAHSQGNLFTYEAYEALGDESTDGWMQEYFEAISIASPMTADIKPGTPRIDWDNDLVPRIATFGFSDSDDIGSEVRKVSWEDLSDQNEEVPYEYSYVFKSQIGNIFQNRFRPAEDGVDTNVHAFTFYMGQAIKDGDTGELFYNPFDGGTLSDPAARTKIMAAIEHKLTVLEAKPSQWNIESNNETTNVCKERRAKLVHFKNAVTLADDVFPFSTDSVVIDGTEHYIGKVYQVPDENGMDKYVLASAEGTQIVDVEGQGIILDGNGNDVGCYQLDGTGDEIKKSCGNVNTTDGVITVDLSWKNPQIDMELSVRKDEAPVGTLELEDIECPREYFYITEADVEEGKYLISIGGPEASGVDADLLPESIRINIGAPDGGMDVTIPIPDPELLNMGPVAYVLVKMKEDGVRLAVEPAPEFIERDIPFTAETYKVINGDRYDYKTVSLLSKVELGPIANAYVEVTPLEGVAIGDIVYTGYTSTGDTLETTGLLLLPDSFKRTLSDDSLYLVSATGGEDVDANDDLIRDAVPTVNYGTVHAIVTGRAIKANGLKLNIMTEIGYQVSKELLDYPEKRDEVIARLDDAADVLCEMDVNGDGVIDHADLHAWVPSFDKPKLRVDYNGKIHPIVLKIYNAEDAYDDAQKLIYPATPPVANAGEDLSIEFGESVTLDGSESYDSDGYIVEFLWREGEVIYCRGETPGCVIDTLSAGSHLLELAVKDDKGKECDCRREE